MRVRVSSIDDDDVAIDGRPSYEEIVARSGRMRSPVVLDVIERHRRGLSYSLDLIHSP